MKNKIAILTSGHPPLDERIYWKFARSLSNHDYDVAIFASIEDLHEQKNNISINSFDGNSFSKKEKIKLFYKLLTEFKPNIIICCEPLTILSAHKYKKQHDNNCIVISDITEWYPENFTNKLPFIKTIFFYPLLFLFNIYAVNLANGIIIGEPRKKRRYNLIAPFKQKAIIGYYPILKYFKYASPPFDGNKLTICYAGLISFKRGILKMLHTLIEVAKRNSEIEIIFVLAGKFQNGDEEKEFGNISKQITSVSIHKIGWHTYDEISNQLLNADICFDLRERNFIYKNSLPIKIFEYFACGKPVIFSNIKPIRDEMNFSEFGFLVDPNKQHEIINAIEFYIRDKNKLIEHSINARRYIENGNNWETESMKLVSFIQYLSKD